MTTVGFFILVLDFFLLATEALLLKLKEALPLTLLFFALVLEALLFAGALALGLVGLI